MPVVEPFTTMKAIDARVMPIDKNTPGKLRVGNNVNIKNMELVDSKQITIDFEFRSDYIVDTAPCGLIHINGSLLYTDKNCEKLVKDWKDGNISKEFNKEIVNSILRKCLTKAVELAYDLNLPAPIQMPFAVDKEEK